MCTLDPILWISCDRLSQKWLDWIESTVPFLSPPLLSWIHNFSSSLSSERHRPTSWYDIIDSFVWDKFAVIIPFSNYILFTFAYLYIAPSINGFSLSLIITHFFPGYVVWAFNCHWFLFTLITLLNLKLLKKISSLAVISHFFLIKYICFHVLIQRGSMLNSFHNVPILLFAEWQTVWLACDTDTKHRFTVDT